MTTVREILLQSGLSDYEVNSLDSRTVDAFSNVLTKAETDRVSVTEFWQNVYNPGISAWENERAELARKAAQAEAKAAYLERERESLKQSGLVDSDLPNFTPARTPPGQVAATPGTPQFSDSSEFVSRASQGLAAIADADWKHRQLYGSPLPISPSELVRQADAQGVDPLTFADRKFNFTKREQEMTIQKIRDEERAKVAKEFGEKFGPNPDVAQPRGTSGAGMAQVRRDMLDGKVKDPTRMSPEERRAQTLAAIHRAVEEREQRDV